MDAEKQLQKMSDEHRKQSGFIENDAPPTPQAYEEKKDQYDTLAKRVESSKSNYEWLRKKARDKIKKEPEKKKPIIEIAQGKSLGMKAYGWSKKFSDNYNKIFNNLI